MSTRPGERKLQILQTLAAMLESPRPEKITTAALAAKNPLQTAVAVRQWRTRAVERLGSRMRAKRSISGGLPRTSNGIFRSGASGAETMTRLTPTRGAMPLNSRSAARFDNDCQSVAPGEETAPNANTWNWVARVDAVETRH